MRPKEWQCVVGFPSTTEAMEFERLAKEAGLTGRLIPVPREITMGCGLAWREDPRHKERIEKLIIENQVKSTGYYDLYI